MDDLGKLRERIDSIDKQLVELLNERAKVALEIGQFKERKGLPIYAPEREDKLLRGIETLNTGPLTVRSLRAIYREIMSASLSLEKDLVIACPGPPGGLPHQAAISKFGSSVEFSFHPEIADVFLEVDKNAADCGVVPVETAERGPVAQTLDSLARHDLSICAEILFPEQKSDNPPERFFVISKNPSAPSGRDRSFVLLRLEDRPGALVEALEPFLEREVNLRHFASRPAAGGSTDLLFFAEAAGHLKELLSNDLLRELSKRCRAVKVLGSYPETGRTTDSEAGE